MNKFNKKVFLSIFLTLLLCGCHNLALNDNDIRLKYEPTETNYEIKKENIYGCWYNNFYDIFDGDNITYTANPNTMFIFNKDDGKYCYYDENNNQVCDTFYYDLSENEISIKMSTIDEYSNIYSINLIDFEDNSALITLSFINNRKEHRYRLILSESCILN
ncbi:MAG: hypothetical protein ACI4XR_00645 [Bacilli bacterium]